METLHALGLHITPIGTAGEFAVHPDKRYEVNLEGIIDGGADAIYTATGVILACGAPDLPHLEEVCRANDSKFPGGVATIRPSDGKYLKPEGWKGPDHTPKYPAFSMCDLQASIIESKKEKA